ncbi:hypothetical protein [Marinomonas algicola]|jgi:hypothetical protein|uniref:hypothetical protein n=1 Tax=Marinomonas algicola TaxID=2773454 RepID=UPI00174834D1|nr:hypothetical protein [Marinomonas algicola]
MTASNDIKEELIQNAQAISVILSKKDPSDFAYDLVTLVKQRDDLIYSIDFHVMPKEFWQKILEQNESVSLALKKSQYELLEKTSYSIKSRKALGKYKDTLNHE